MQLFNHKGILENSPVIFEFIYNIFFKLKVLDISSSQGQRNRFLFVDIYSQMKSTIKLTWNKERKLSVQSLCSASRCAVVRASAGAAAWRGARGNSCSQGSCGCCQYKQHWWNRARGDVSSVNDEVSRQRTKLAKKYILITLLNSITYQQ